MARWLVDLVGKRVTRLGTVMATTERDAIDEVTKRFGIEPVNRSYKVDEDQRGEQVGNPATVGSRPVILPRALVRYCGPDCW